MSVLPDPWPQAAAQLVDLQLRLAALPGPTLGPPPWRVAGCFACSARWPGDAEHLWAAAAVDGRPPRVAVHDAPAPAPYARYLLALREGALLAAALEAIRPFDLLVVNATGRDHPRRAGLAVHLGAALGVPSLGVTNRPLVATGPWPADQRGALAPLMLDGEPVGYWLRVRAGARPLAIHAGFGLDAERALELVAQLAHTYRTPPALRLARQAARARRAATAARPFARPER